MNDDALDPRIGDSPSPPAPLPPGERGVVASADLAALAQKQGTKDRGPRTNDNVRGADPLVLLAADLVFFFLAVQLFADAGGKVDRAFGLLVLVFAAAIGLFAVLQFASGERQIYGRFNLPTAFFGPYDNADHFAGLMEMLIPVAVFYIVGARASHSLRSEPALSGAKGPARASVAAVEACPVGDRRKPSDRRSATRPPRPLPSPLAGEGPGVRGQMRVSRPPSSAALSRRCHSERSEESRS